MHTVTNYLDVSGTYSKDMYSTCPLSFNEASTTVFLTWFPNLPYTTISSPWIFFVGGKQTTTYIEWKI